MSALYSLNKISFITFYSRVTASMKIAIGPNLLRIVFNTMCKSQCVMSNKKTDLSNVLQIVSGEYKNVFYHAEMLTVFKTGSDSIA